MASTTDVPKWFQVPIKTFSAYRRDFYICTNCRGQSCGGVYSSICPKCHGIQSDPPRHVRSEYLCNTCARSPQRSICTCDYPVVHQPPVPCPSNSPSSSPSPSPTPNMCCCHCDWCTFLCRCVCCCVTCAWQSSSCKYCCTSIWHCCGKTCYWSWCGCSSSRPPV